MKFSTRLTGKITNKLSSSSGESIAETMVALLIAALAILMLAGAMMTASNIVTRSRNKLNEYYDKTEDVIKDVTNPGKTANGTVTISKSDASFSISPSVRYKKNDKFSQTPVAVYGYRNP